MVKELNSEKRMVKEPNTKEAEQAKEVSKRQRALEFAKNLPKPVLKNSRSRTVQNGFHREQCPEHERISSQLEFLEYQHQLYQKKINSIAN
jgi:hypothetical protein